jgi:hypothetical protein
MGSESAAQTEMDFMDEFMDESQEEKPKERRPERPTECKPHFSDLDDDERFQWLKKMIDELGHTSQ